MLVGCGDDTNTNSTGGSNATPIALEDLSKKMSGLYCDLAFSCCTAMEQSLYFNNLPTIPKTVAECSPAIQAQLDMFIFAGLKDAVNAGRLKYDGALAGTCFGQVEVQCAVLSQNGPLSDPQCDKVFVGLVADGGDCGQDNECAVAGSYCPIPQGAMLGKCAALPKEGEACAFFRCADGLGCDTVNGMNVCVKPGPDGQACASTDACISKYCDFTAMKCAQPKAIGDTCVGSYECKDGYCDSQSKKCVALKAGGEACTSFDECESFDCDVDMKCAPGMPACDGI